MHCPRGARGRRLLADALLPKGELFGYCIRENTINFAAEVAAEVKIPIIGIGAGSGVDGQVLVLHDIWV